MNCEALKEARILCVNHYQTKDCISGEDKKSAKCTICTKKLNNNSELIVHYLYEKGRCEGGNYESGYILHTKVFEYFPSEPLIFTENHCNENKYINLNIT